MFRSHPNSTRRDCILETNRRSFLTAITAVLGALALHGFSLGAQPASDARRPNLLYIMTDQQHAGMMSCTGNKYLKTPAMDSLAANGTRFERAYASNPVCLPSRVTMMTGYMPSHFGIKTNAGASTQMPEAVLMQSMGWIFRNAGYETAFGGKTHWPRGMTPESLGFQSISRDQREQLAEASARFIQTKRDKPFLLVVSLINPHDICYMAIDDYTRATKTPAMYPKSTVERERLAEALKLPEGVSRKEFFERLCPPLPDNYEVPALEPECITKEYLEARPFRAYAREHFTDERWRLHRWAYCRLTERVDGHVGRILGALRQAGLEQETVIVFSSDHGDLNAAHRLEHKSILYEEAARVPFIVSYKGVTAAGRVDDKHLVSSGLDLIPTLCDYAGIEPPPGLSGRSVRALAEGREVDAWRDQVAVESRAGRMLRTDRFKYNVYESGRHREQLINLANDPGEMINLAENPKYKDVLTDHRKRLRRWVEQIGDEIGKAYVPSGQE
jgi:arylsulfatase A-like enzyme